MQGDPDDVGAPDRARLIAQLKEASSHRERAQAVSEAIQRGLPLHEVERLLDWVEASLRAEERRT